MPGIFFFGIFFIHTAPMFKSLYVRSLILVEWYDGFVSGIIQGNKENYIAAMVYFDPGTTHRLYAIVEMPAGENLEQAAKDLNHLCEGNQSLSHSRFRGFESMSFSLGTIDDDMDIYLYPALDVEVDKIRELRWPVIDKAADPGQRLLWEYVVERCPRMNPRT